MAIKYRRINILNDKEEFNTKVTRLLNNGWKLLNEGLKIIGDTSMCYWASFIWSDEERRLILMSQTDVIEFPVEAP